MSLAHLSRLFYVQVSLFAVLLVFASVLGAQVERQLISVGGGSASTQSYYVSYSIGEPISGRRDVNNFSVFQGFEQPDQLEGALPISWLSFTAEAVGKNNLLSWRVGLTGREADFVVERSIDGFSFFEVMILPSSDSGAEQEAFNWTDTSFPPALLYYRIRQRDRDGAETISPLQVIDRRAEAEVGLLLYPNPAYGSVNWHLQNEIIGLGTELQLFDAAGRKVRDFSLRGEGGQLPLTGLPPGAYNYLCILRSGAQNNTRKTIQNRGRLIVR